jgi:hypothetical protein
MWEAAMPGRDKMGGDVQDVLDFLKHPIRFVTPSQIKNAAAEVNAYAQGLNSDIVTHARAEFTGKWQPVYESWKTFFASVHGLETWTAGTMDRIDEWRTKIDQWKSALITEEGDVHATTPSATPGAGTPSSQKAAKDAEDSNGGGIDLMDGVKWMAAGIGLFFIGKSLLKGVII